MSEANFTLVFFGIDSPDPRDVDFSQKKVNAIRSLTESIANVHGAGIFATAGIIVGFDSEKGGVAEGIVDYIRGAPITVVHPGLLVALPNTQFFHRLKREGRLHANAELSLGEQATWGLNFETKRPRREVLKDYVTVLDALFTPGSVLFPLARTGTGRQATQAENAGGGSNSVAEHPQSHAHPMADDDDG